MQRCSRELMPKVRTAQRPNEGGSATPTVCIRERTNNSAGLRACANDWACGQGRPTTACVGLEGAREELRPAARGVTLSLFSLSEMFSIYSSAGLCDVPDPHMCRWQPKAWVPVPAEAAAGRVME